MDGLAQRSVRAPLVDIEPGARPEPWLNWVNEPMIGREKEQVPQCVRGALSDRSCLRRVGHRRAAVLISLLCAAKAGAARATIHQAPVAVARAKTDSRFEPGSTAH